MRRQLFVDFNKYPYYRVIIILPRQLSQSSISRIDDMLGYRPKRTRREEGLVSMPRNSCRKMSWRFQKAIYRHRRTASPLLTLYLFVSNLEFIIMVMRVGNISNLIWKSQIPLHVTLRQATSLSNKNNILYVHSYPSYSRVVHIMPA